MPSASKLKVKRKQNIYKIFMYLCYLLVDFFIVCVRIHVCFLAYSTLTSVS